VRYNYNQCSFCSDTNNFVNVVEIIFKGRRIIHSDARTLKSRREIITRFSSNARLLFLLFDIHEMEFWHIFPKKET